MVIAFQLEEAQAQSQCNPNQSNPLSGRCQNLVEAAVLALAQVGIIVTGQSSGQASFLTGLEHNYQNQSNAGNDLQNCHNTLQNLHFRLPPSTSEFQSSVL